MKFSHAFLDLDGTVYVDGELIPGVLDSLIDLKKSGTQIFYMTNNTSVAVTDYYQKLADFGLPVEDGCIITPTLTLSEWLKNGEIDRFYSVGTSAFESELSEFSGKKSCISNPQIVVVAFDTELNYSKLRKACHFINSGVPWVITHIDLACPSLDGPVPDCGSIARLISSTTGVDYIDHFGKPGKYMMDMIKGITSASPYILVAGDRLYTDIQIGVSLEATTILVCSGEYKRGIPIPFESGDVWVYETLHEYLNTVN